VGTFKSDKQRVEELAEQLNRHPEFRDKVGRKALIFDTGQHPEERDGRYSVGLALRGQGVRIPSAPPFNQYSSF
jgi:hypothetical protein